MTGRADAGSEHQNLSEEAIMIRARLLMVPIVLGAIACKPEAIPPTHSVSVGEPLEMVRLRAEPYTFTYNSGLTESARIVVRDADHWREVWRAIWRDHSPGPPLPPVDFERELIVVAALGQRPTGGFSILLESAARAGSGAVVSVRTTAPGPRCGTTAALTEPVDIARLPRVEGEIRFEEKTESHNCS